MTHLKIQANKLRGEVVVPPSKSLTHRAIISASLAEGQSEIKNIQFSEDIMATINGMRELGAVIEEKENSISVQGIEDFHEVKNRLINCYKSGSTYYFLLPVSTLFKGEIEFIGEDVLNKRTIDIYEEIFKEQEVSYKTSKNKELETKVEGQLAPGDFTISGDLGSQFITGLLFTLPLLDGDSTLTLTTPLDSNGYIESTLTVLKSFGITIDHNNYRRFKIPGNQNYLAKDYVVEGDYSQAALWLSAGALGSDIEVSSLNQYSLQEDSQIIDVLKGFNAEINTNNDKIRVSSEQLVGDLEMEGSQSLNIIPITALVASLSKGQTVISNLSRLNLQFKESNRLEATQEELAKIGADVQVIEDKLHIQGVKELQGGAVVSSRGDHRMAMMLAIASTVSKEPIFIKDTEVVSKSYPEFWDDFVRMGGEITEVSSEEF